MKLKEVFLSTTTILAQLGPYFDDLSKPSSAVHVAHTACSTLKYGGKLRKILLNLGYQNPKPKF